MSDLGHSETSVPYTRLKVEIVSRDVIDIEVPMPMREAWGRREELMAPHIPDGWVVSRYWVEGNARG